ncbi:hypothetical protein LCGC14_0953360 [marine sediment metagenome]|uniref:Uncharacterized protein n=1 Tax=marine sediment metagenome TaxID=412755 RepID=A0A0F9RMZ7_9ZZZZ
MNQVINVVGKEIFNFSKNIDVENLDNITIEAFLKKMESYPEKLIVKAIFKLFEEIEDENSFIKVLYVVDICLKLNTLPSKTVEYLRFNVKKERTMYRLLFLYQSFYFAGYKLEKSILDVFKELNIDGPAVNELFEKFEFYVESLGYVGLFNESFQPSYELFNIDKIINELKPLNDNSPIFDNQGTIGYKLPKNIDLKIDKHVHQLKEIYNSPEMKKAFLSAFSEEFSINSVVKNNIFLFFEAKELHVKGKNNKALLLINRVLKKNPNLAPAFILKGEILSELHQFHYAIRCYLKSIELDPYRFHAYSQLSYTLQIGGYFHSSLILCGHLIKFFPLDFNLYVQLAFSTYQLSKPFKRYLKVAGLLEPERLINFLDRFWIREKIEAKGSLDALRIKNETILEIEKDIAYISNNLLQFLTYYNILIQNDEFKEEFYEIISDPLYFFPEKLGHTKKNHFIYELATCIATNMVGLIDDLEPEAERYFLNEGFLQFCFKITREITNKILEKNLKFNKVKKTISLDLVISKNWIEDSLKNSLKEPYFNLIKTLMQLREFYKTIQMSINDLASDCFNCPAKCLIYAPDIFPNIEEPCNDWEEFNKKKYEKEITLNRSKFEKDFIPIFSSFEKYLRDKALSEKTIEEKISVSLEFLKFVFFNLDIQLNDFNKDVNDDMLKLFLEKHVIDNKLVQSKTAWGRVQRGLNTFLSYLSNELNYFSGDRLKSLKETIKMVQL